MIVFLGYLGTILGTESERPKLDKLIGKRSKSGGFNRNLALAKPLEIEEKRRKNKIAKSKIIYFFSNNSCRFLNPNIFFQFELI